ncbi:hypothetical protein FHS95_003233 [Sphingomonas naasensis]|nr:hypothetical protein [Sphingomonas naasensis]
MIVNHPKLTDRVEFWSSAEERLNRELAITKTLRTPVNFIVHTLQEVNDGLAHGRYFFMDVARDGIALYQSDDTELHQPNPVRFLHRDISLAVVAIAVCKQAAVGAERPAMDFRSSARLASPGTMDCDQDLSCNDRRRDPESEGDRTFIALGCAGRRQYARSPRQMTD